MSAAAPPTSSPSPPPRPAKARLPRQRRRASGPAVALLARGEPWVWLTGGTLTVCLAMIVGLMLLVLYQGLVTFWPQPVVRMQLADGRTLMGEVTRREADRSQAPAAEAPAPPSQPTAAADPHRDLLRTGNFELTGAHFAWVDEADVKQRSQPRWALVVERVEWGRFYGLPLAILQDSQPLADARNLEGPAQEDACRQIYTLFEQYHQQARAQRQRVTDLETHQIGQLSRQLEESRLTIRQAELRFGLNSPQHQQAAAEAQALRAGIDKQLADLREEIQTLKAQNARVQLLLATADGRTKSLPLADVVRLYPANQLTLAGKLKVYLSRWWEFVSAWPREANSEGGVFPAIYGTVLMTLLMSIAVVPFGVMAALYLREYARGGWIVSLVRIAINNLAGVPSIVFGVFGLGFFCYIVGAGIDQLLFAAQLPNPTFGKGGLLWASLTLALLTLPVVIVATEEALAAVPRSMREGSYACGASKWQTVRRIVLPRAMPGIMTGAILAMARGAGEVAPLMLVGAAKLAPELPADAAFPFLHPQRSFMHLGFHIYDLGFQSQNSEAAKPMVFTTTLLLILLVALLNITAIRLRSRLRRRFVGNQF
ncbi:MAG: phosphate ABC transporter permease PstA [Phycisphaeraceae bacterium]|nr:phosphate ABC transporter permease PstA [Phycisphaeraceae bacterium]